MFSAGEISEIFLGVRVVCPPQNTTVRVQMKRDRSCVCVRLRAGGGAEGCLQQG